VIIFGIGFQVLVAFAMVNLPFIVSAFEYLAHGLLKMKDATSEGTKFAFGYVGGGALPFEIKEGSSAFILAFQALPNAILSGALAAILTYFRILPFIAKAVGCVFKLIFRVKESIGMVAVAKVFLGQCEAPLLIKHELGSLRKPEIFTILTLGFATAAVSVMPMYAGCLKDVCPDSMRHIIMSSVIGMISTLLVCTLMMPGGKSEAPGATPVVAQRPYGSLIEAMSKGISDGAFVWWCIVGSLIGAVALLAIFNYILALLPDVSGEPVTLQRIFGFFMYPFAWLLGIQNQDIPAISQILGTKIALNETVAFFDLAKATVSQDSVVKTIYAIMNFGNFSTVGITVGAMSVLAPTQGSTVAKNIWRAFLAGLLAVGLSSSIMSIFFSL
jgi:CNT family concentrative nucleoside transporter